MKIETPWGVVDKSSDSFHLDVIELCLKQLNDYQDSGNITSFLQNDICGYKILLKSNNDLNCKIFLRIKSQFKNSKRFKNNIEVINYMKEENLWID